MGTKWYSCLWCKKKRRQRYRQKGETETDSTEMQIIGRRDVSYSAASEEFFDACEDFHGDGTGGESSAQNSLTTGQTVENGQGKESGAVVDDRAIAVSSDSWKVRDGRRQSSRSQSEKVVSGVDVPSDAIPKVVHMTRQLTPCLPLEIDETDVKYVKTLHPPAGASGIPKRESALGPPDMTWVGHGVWEQAEGVNFSVRSESYMTTRIKSKSIPEVYQIVTLDIYSVDLKTQHIARKVTLPKVSEGVKKNAERLGLPPQLIINMMLPKYPAKLFGVLDGPGYCVTYYLELPETWDPEKHSTPAAFGLIQRFFDNGIEKDGTPTRDRLKLIPRLVNLEQLVEDGIFSSTEYRLINSYRDKPLLTRPQHTFYHGEFHVEIDLDVHSYAYVARRALASFFQRLGDIVYELGFVVQGNAAEELPEQMLACVRNYRMDYNVERPLPTGHPVCE